MAATKPAPTATAPAAKSPVHNPRLRWGVAVGLLLIATLALRVWGVKSGLPYAYNTDEYDHFVPKAIALFGHGWNPNYFANPPGFTYLLYVVYAVWFGGGAALQHTFASNPTEVWEVGRITSGVLGTLAVWLLYLAGARFFDRRTALLAAGVEAVAFLPVFYGHLALNDVPTLAPLTLSLWGTAGVLRHGRRRDYVIAGVGLGLACATKYTGGIVLLPLLVAALIHLADPKRRLDAIAGLLLVGLTSLGAFLIANPYALLSYAQFHNGIAHQQDVTDDPSGKLGLTHGSGITYYLWSVTWGLGWAPGIASIFGAVISWKRERKAFLVLVPVVVIFFIFMGTQGRYFGRWLMPILPMLCLLGAYAALQIADWLGARLRGLRPTLIAVAVVALCAQGLVHSVHSDLINSRQDTRNLARAWLLTHVTPCQRLAVEPVVPTSWTMPAKGVSGCSDPTSYYSKFTALRTHTNADGTLSVNGGAPIYIEQYETTLEPALINLYVQKGYCYVVTGETQEGRAQVDPGPVPNALPYYAALAKRGTLVYEASPYGQGDKPVRFNFDWTFDYYPLSYSRPGPDIRIYHLHGGACGP
jgi:4-amino-4-deoxy-L-arabinose transferase-like glycosyltransferase